jgi:hypothetical protein
VRFKFLLLAIFCSSASFAGGCPPWLMCGKWGNRIISDPSYSAQVAAAEASAPPTSTASSFALSSSDHSADIITRIINAKKLARDSSGVTVRMFENADDALRQQYLSMHPKPGFWGYDWGKP